MALAIKGTDLKLVVGYDDKLNAKNPIRKQKGILGATADKTWGTLTTTEKADVAKAVAISLGLVAPDP